jgi:hypothetical protein
MITTTTSANLPVTEISVRANSVGPLLDRRIVLHDTIIDAVSNHLYGLGYDNGRAYFEPLESEERREIAADILDDVLREMVRANHYLLSLVETED